MAGSKRIKLTARSEVVRAGERESVAIAGRCQVGEGAGEAVDVLDLDAHGCRLRGLGLAVSKTATLQLWLGPIGPLPARLKWLKHGDAGIAFDRLLTPEEVAGASQSPGANVVTLRRGARGLVREEPPA
jgi:hypothetical protein